MVSGAQSNALAWIYAPEKTWGDTRELYVGNFENDVYQQISDGDDEVVHLLIKMKERIPDLYSEFAVESK